MRLLHVELTCDNFSNAINCVSSIFKNKASCYSWTQPSLFRASSCENPGFVVVQYPPQASKSCTTSTSSKRVFVSPSGRRNDLALAASDIFSRLWSKAYLYHTAAGQRTKNTILDICMEVKHIGQIAASKHGRMICRRSLQYYDPYRNESYLVNVLKSCVGNLWHTLVQPIKKRSMPLEDLNNSRLVDYAACFDHVTLACPRGHLESVLKWYETTLGMRRFHLNSKDSDSEGFLVRYKNSGMRLKAFDHYWRCAEEGLVGQSADSTSSFRFVLAESLDGSCVNQIDTFLKAHGCPGVQHIGLRVEDLVMFMEELQGENVLKIIQPPGTYYSNDRKVDEMMAFGVNSDDLRRHGILFDTETSGGHLLQAFSQPFFAAGLGSGEETFFFEILERRGARGFGAGNIEALWHAVETYHANQNESATQLKNLAS